ncbi:MAG: FtsH protease activity modulator HflK, partial [Planctomycetota bacterium]
MALRLSSSSSQFEDFRPQISVRIIALGVIVVLAVIGLWGSFYTVQTEEVGVVLRFGEYIKTVDPGLR